MPQLSREVSKHSFNFSLESKTSNTDYENQAPDSNRSHNFIEVKFSFSSLGYSYKYF